MDQDAYHKTYNEINERFCLYEKAILADHCRCVQASRFYLAERVGVHCRMDEGQQRCGAFLKLLRDHARFTLKLTRGNDALPHAKALRLQVGGLKGLHQSLHQEQLPPDQIDDIFQLLQQAEEIHEQLERLPFQEIIKQVAAFKGRNRRSRR